MPAKHGALRREYEGGTALLSARQAGPTGAAGRRRAFGFFGSREHEPCIHEDALLPQPTLSEVSPAMTAWLPMFSHPYAHG